ncbi:hypothetical protein SUGI_0990520 [Cryptomeria japonica]|nr:hypothetical protein SUGI_0990520 [Cryptomeria japonica]
MAAGGGKEGPRLQFNDAATADIDLLIYTPSSSITIKLHSVVVREVAGVFREFATMEPQRCKQWKPLKVKDMGLTKIDNYQGRDNMMLYTCEADNVPGRHYLQIIGEEKKRAKDYVSLFRFMYSSYYGEKLIFEDVDDPRHLLETAYALGFYDLVGQYLHASIEGDGVTSPAVQGFIQWLRERPRWCGEMIDRLITPTLQQAQRNVSVECIC